MPLVRIDARSIVDQPSFHDVFDKAFGFPGWYGRNMDAWIDCMSCLDDPDAGMTTVHGTACDPVVLCVDHVDALPAEVYRELVECAASVNWWLVETGRSGMLVLAFDKSNPTPT